MSQPVTFKSKIDTWVLVVVLLVVSLAILAADAVAATESALGWIAAGILALFGVLLPLWILTYTRYELGDRTLEVRCGPFRWTVPIDEISDVSSTQNAARGPALSMQRLRLRYGNGRSLLISPDNRDIFVRSLELRRSELGAGSAAAS